MTRCAAAHPEDPRACEGRPDAVRVVDGAGDEALGCVRHGAALLASLIGGRVYPVTGSAIDVYRRAQTLRPFDWSAT